MSFLKDIEGFSKKKLKSVDTEITTVDGRRLKETRDHYGRCHLENVGGSLGYVGDVKPDLQVGEILDGVILGEFRQSTLYAFPTMSPECFEL